MGISDLNRKYELNEIIRGDSIFCLTGITLNEMLNGVVINSDEYITETLVTHKSLKFKEIIKRTNCVVEWFLFQVRSGNKKKINQNIVDKLRQEYDFSDILSRLIISRKFEDDEIATINSDLDLNNVFLNTEDFNQSIKLVVNCINNKEKICVLGDYDVDGSAATSLFVKFLESINQPFFYYIPDREKDGYGATKKLFQKLILEEPKLIIMVDCGSTSNEAIDFLNENKIKSLIIDHHEINKPFPNANSIINPKKR